MAQPIVVKPWEIRGIDREPPYVRNMKVVIAPDTHGVKDLAICLVTVPVGSKSDEHSHDDSEEFWIFVQGHGEVVVDGKSALVEPGMIAYAPPKSRHYIVNRAQVPLQAFFLFAPPGPEKKLLEMIKGKV